MSTKHAYMAGLIDGEGCISIYRFPSTSRIKRNTYNMILRIGNTSKDMIDWINNNYEGSIHKQKRDEGYKDSFLWSTGAKSAEKILRKTKRYMVSKKGHVKIALQFRETFRNGNCRNGYNKEDEIIREYCYQSMKILNHRGKKF